MVDTAPPMEITPDGANYNLQITAFIAGSAYLSDMEQQISDLLEAITTVTVDVTAVVCSPQ